ncbi:MULTISPECIES: HAD-IC family P-type ATPase [unclassified Polaromonas]|jgi:Ca2+-transporting ATPase|uniref:cation-translocating P-type ATPase n=1 Tax=unclassified Polaromonas TaxID=2638319 RepID=UPI000BC87235|nr:MULTISPECIES: HAD-IC family P-type ATPase [unclassified Polaromonas]OYY36661.1 MAG: haloacid dehalogenase [Polaromonas sp. 35-63-35]OYZ18701.1 MAG: haloacid dehalogenase [Polaromonas sp. 16-63-31]OYZ80894.1 MAG: haloacid dehalogenase [Polaromonas sp. 24-63-21]OZA52892.1 MAG: haloacid dehalogenase [Polaromonas sp. 17-63-33]OZA88257.1 MAG: haloacid dehalogenase [Polaromonas sp. 39-63-25]
MTAKTLSSHSGPAPASPLWHALPAGEVLAQLACDPAVGLSAADVEQRRAREGANTLPEAQRRSMLAVFARQFRSPLIYILFAAAVLAVAMAHYGDAVVILAVVLVNAVVGTFQEGRAERSMASLRRLAALRVRVLRDGQEALVEARELVPGDLLLLAAGDAIGADARLIEEAQLQVAEAALTGESVPVSKAVAPLAESTGLADRRNMLFSGTYATAGRARAVVVAIGSHTEVGRIAGLTETAADPQTPLEQRIAQFGRALVVAALVLFVAVVALGMFRDLPLADVLMVAISQMVSMVPEGLPVAMTIALAVGMQRMAGRGAIIRRLSAVETLGSTTVICTDKTGTLTRNEMTVSALWLPGGLEVSVSGTGYAPEGRLSSDDAALLPLLQAAALCNDAQLLPPEEARTQWSVLGDPTEGALKVLAAKAGINLEQLAREAPREAELAFDADTRMMATRHRFAGAPRRVFIKGAPEVLLHLCAADGTAVIHAARAAADAMAARALRVLAFAVVEDDVLDPEAGFDALAGRAHLLGLAGQIDPPREEVKAAVAECRAAGIRPVMVTGDHKLTGLAIARELGIARDGDRAVDGAELERMNEADLRDGLDLISVFARVHPAQKLRIVEALQAHGEVVAMTGDGVNDAPALARADVGVAMGITGTEVAKSAAKIIITDDNFATIVGAVEQGRVVYGNLKKVILYLFATSIDEVVVLLLALLADYPLPLAAVQILWINIVTEGTLTVNLVMDPPDGDEMKRTPVPRNDRLVDRAMLGRVLLMSATAVLVTFGWFVWRLGQGLPIELVRTETFTVLAMCQWFNVLNCQSATRSAFRLGLLKNPWLLGGLALSIALQVLVLYAPFMNTLFYTVPLAPASLLPLLLLASSVLWAEELRKFVVRLRQKRTA